MICPMCNKREADRLYLGTSYCKECADILEKDAIDFKKWREEKYPHWIDLTDYFPTAYGFGDNPTEPNWNYECSKCGHHIFKEYTPAKCPNCDAQMKVNETISRDYVEKIIESEVVDLKDSTEEWRSAVNETCYEILNKIHNAPTVETTIKRDV